MVNVALPAIAGSLDAGTAVVQWVVLGYLTPIIALALCAGAGSTQAIRAARCASRVSASRPRVSRVDCRRRRMPGLTGRAADGWPPMVRLPIGH